MSGFKFSQPTSTGASGSSLFGTTSNTNTTGSSMFSGGTGSGNTTAPSFSFGQTAATKPGTPSLFGTPSATTAGSSNAFGSAASGVTGSTTFSFGKKPEDSKPDEKPKTLFSTPSASQAPATPGSSAPSLFGSTTPAAASKQSWSFGNTSTTPAGPPPQATTFGASTGGSNLFGSVPTQQSKETTEAAKQPAFSFVKPASNTANASVTDSTKPQITSNLFNAPMTASQPTSSAEAPKPFSFGTPTTATTTKENTAPPLFGTAPSTAVTATTTSQSTPSLFGSAQTSTGNTSSNLFGKPATTSDPSPSLFAQPAKGAMNAAPKPNFGFPTATTQTSNTPTTAAPTGATPIQKPLFSLGAPNGTSSSAAPTPSLFKTPATGAAATTSASAAPTLAAPTAGLFNLGGAAAPPAATTTSSAPAIPATTSSATGNVFNLGAPAGTSATSTANSTAKPEAGPVTSTLGASTSGPTPPAQSRLRNKTLDEILTRWATDLTRYSKDFKNQAETIAQWDQIIVDNSSKIDKLYVKTRTCEKQTMSVEMQLAAIENQQNELESWLSKYENDVEEMLAKDGNTQTELGGPDQERERTYKLAEKLGERLDDMGRDLESMVEEVNAANASLSKYTKSDEPITQIVRILNSHLTQLQQIDQGTAALQTKIAAAQKAANHLGYLNGSASGEGRAAVEDFYRSYMGRR